MTTLTLKLPKALDAQLTTDGGGQAAARQQNRAGAPGD